MQFDVWSITCLPILVPVLLFLHRLDLKISVNNFPTQISVSDTCRIESVAKRHSLSFLSLTLSPSVSRGDIKKFIEKISSPFVWLRGYLCVKWAVLCYIVYLNFKWIVFPINRVLCWRIRNAKISSQRALDTDKNLLGNGKKTKISLQWIR